MSSKDRGEQRPRLSTIEQAKNLARGKKGGRRSALLFGGVSVVSGLLALYELNRATDHPSSSPKGAPSERKEKEHKGVSPEKTIINGIEVYGVGSQTYTTKEQLYTLRDQFNDAFEKQLGLPNDLSTIEKREKLTDDTRYLQLYVQKHVYEKFLEEQASGAGVDLPTWLQYHIDRENKQIHDTPREIPACTLQAKLQRIIVVADSLTEKDMPDGPKDTPLDIDGQWFMDADYRGMYDQTTDTWSGASDAVKSEKIDGKIVGIDWNLVHEWRHRLFQWQDEYIQQVTATTNPSIPFMTIANSIGTEAITPWAQYFFHRMQQLHKRGYYVDSRYVNNDSSLEHPYNIWGLVPSANTFHFIDVNGDPITGKITAYRSNQKVPLGKDPYYVDPKPFDVVINTQTDGTLDLTSNVYHNAWFGPRVINEETIFPTNWYLEIEQPDGGVFGIHIPGALFTMSAMNGADQADYTIQFIKQPGKASQQINMFIAGSYTPFEQTFARVAVSGTPIEMFYDMY